MRHFKSVNFKVILSFLLFAILFYVGCGGSDDTSVISNITGINKITDDTSNEPLFASIEDENQYYANLEIKLNETLSGPSAAPSKCATTGLLSVTLNITTDEIKTTANYDLASKIVVTASIAGQQPKVIVPVWAKYSGSGALNGTVYTSIAKCETAIFTATYTEDGVSKLALFRLKVNGLTAITINKTTSEVQLPSTFDLGTELSVIAKYYNGNTKEIDTTTGLTWVTNGTGILNGTTYTPPAKVETATFTASYIDSGITKTVAFRLIVTGLSTLTLNKVTDEIQLPETYDLASKVVATSKLSNGQISVVTPVWSIHSGKGTLNGSVYTPGAFYETAVFIASYAEPNTTLTKTAQFRLTVTGLSSISLSQVTDEIQLPSTYNLASELIVKALYSDKSTQEITTDPNLSWILTAGTGMLNGSIYTPAAKVETAVFTASYTNAGIIKTTRFSLKIIGLSSLALNKTTDEIQSCATYNIAEKLILTDKLSNGAVKVITTDPNTTWTLASGRGILAGMVYTTPALAETAVIRASYTDAGIMKTINFRLRVNALTSLTLSKTTDETFVLTPYDLISKTAVFAKFSNGQTVEVTTNPNLKWTISFGSGTLNNAVYTTPERVETTTLIATYSESGVTQSARFNLKVLAVAPGIKTQLVGVSISKSTDTVEVGKTYDLSLLKAVAKYSDKTTREVTLSWIVTLGGGFVAGNIYTTPDNVGTTRLMGSCTAEDGSVKSVYFTITIYSTQILGNSGIVTPGGILLSLDNSIEVEIPANSVDNTGKLSISKPTESCFNVEGQGSLQFTSTTNIKQVKVRIPIRPGTLPNDVNAVFIIQSQNIIVKVTPRIVNDYCEFNLGTPQNMPAGTFKMIGFDEPFPGHPVLTSTPTLFIYSKYNQSRPKDGSDSMDDIFYERIISKPNSQNIKWPYYCQYENTCWATSLLMLMRGYTKNISSNFDAIYKIVKTYANYVDPNGFGNHLYYDTDPLNKKLFSFVLTKGNMNIPLNLQNNAGIYALAYYCVDKKALLHLLVWNFSRKVPAPVLVSSRSHSILFLGLSSQPPTISPIQRYDDKLDRTLPSINFCINDPGLYNPMLTHSFDTIINTDLKLNKGEFDDYIAYISYPVQDGSTNTKTMHLSEAIILNENDQEIAKTLPNTIAENGIAWNNTLNISKGTNIKFATNIFNSENDKNIKALVRCQAIESNGTIIKANWLKNIKTNNKIIDIKQSNPNELMYPYFQLLQDDDILKTIQKKVNDEIKKPCEFTLITELISNEPGLLENDPANIIPAEFILDKFDLKIKISPSTQKHLRIIPPNSINITDPKAELKAEYGVEPSFIEVSNVVKWTVNSVELTDEIFKPSESGTLSIKATLKKGTVINGETIEEDIIEYGSIHVNPEIKGSGTTKVQNTEQYNFEFYTEDSPVPIETRGSVVINWSVNGGGYISNTGLFTPNKTGTYIISATCMGETATFEVLVSPSELIVIPNNIMLKLSEKCTFIAKADGEIVDAEWSTDAGNIEAGVHTASPTPSTYFVRAKYCGIEATAQVIVKPQELKITPGNAMLNLNQQMQFTALLDDETKETNVTWSVSNGGGNINQAGLYTAPGQWGTYKIFALYEGKAASAEVIVNDERIQLVSSISSTLVRSSAINVNNVPFSPEGSTIFSIESRGAIASTVELSIREGASKGRLQYLYTIVSPYYWTLYRTASYYTFYAPPSDRPYYDTNEIIHIDAKCPDNQKALGVMETTICRPLLSDTIEVMDGDVSTKRKWQYKVIGYRRPDGGWENFTYNSQGGTVYYLYHGPYYGIYIPNNFYAYNEYYDRNMEIGTWTTYYNDGKLANRKIFREDFKEYELNAWTYNQGWQFVTGVGYVPTYSTQKLVEKYSRTSISQGWTLVPGSHIVTTYDGWEAN